jgi:hypothetical protein
MDIEPIRADLTSYANNVFLNLLTTMLIEKGILSKSEVSERLTEVIQNYCEAENHELKNAIGSALSSMKETFGL